MVLFTAARGRNAPKVHRGKNEHGGGGINCEFGTNIYTRPYIKEITNKDLLEATGNADQCSVMSYLGHNLKKNRYMCMENRITLLHN